MEARGKFGEHERCVRVARGDSRVRTAKSMNTQLIRTAKSMNKFFYTERHQILKSAQRSFSYCDRAQNSHNAQKSKQTCLFAGQKHATFLYFGLSENT